MGRRSTDSSTGWIYKAARKLDSTLTNGCSTWRWRSIVRGKRVLDAFCNQGPFAFMPLERVLAPVLASIVRKTRSPVLVAMPNEIGDELNSKS